MNWLGFIGLMRSIYGPGLPDLGKIQRQGLLAVKIGQTFALRADFLDEAKCRHLAKLYRQTLSLPPEDIDRLLAGAPAGWRGSFAEIDRSPLASASVGQVHRATLRDGRAVVVKLVKGDFARRFTGDVRSLRRLVGLAILLYPKLRKVADPAGILDHIEEYTLTELDLRNEVAHGDVLRRVRDEYRDRYDLSALAFPAVHRELSGEKVLVTEFIAGPTLDELLDEGKLPYDVLLKLFAIHGFFIFGPGVFHGDIHPGNIILNGGKLYFVDTGALSRIGDRIRTGLFRFFEALCQYDFPACAERINAMAERGLDGAPYRRFREKFLALYRDFPDTTVAQVSLTRKMMDTIKLAVHSGMVFERGMYPVIKSMMYLDGMVLRCKPDAVLMRDMRGPLAAFRRALPPTAATA
ncbi:MAG: AarF/ABC1/UbiB kinase family protein [Candidatus Edwardsbacteria bacterium]|jgi:ubiquinone biosynthesis protein|nr:AarF/ABC1/UbiB kinase family protein [Candidatus Edwardsbacteria bacterium]